MVRGRVPYVGLVGIRRGIVVAFVTLAALVATTTPAASETPVLRAAMPPLHALRGDNARLVDGRGRTVLLRGVNVNGLGEYYQEWADLPALLPLTEDDFGGMEAIGLNAVRLIVTWSSLEPVPGIIDNAYLDRVVQTIDWAHRHGVYVLVDMHQDAWGVAVDTPDGVTCPSGLTRAIGWDGAPAWATSFVGGVLTCTAGSRELSVAVQTSFSRFYANALGIQDHLLRVWQAVARRVSVYSNVAGYDLLNEPNPGMTPGVNDYALLGAFYQRAIAAIRAGEKQARGYQLPVFFEPAVITGPLSVPGPLLRPGTDQNLVYAPHLYNESISPLPGSMERGFGNAAKAARRYGVPFFSGEWGWFGDPARDQPFIERYGALEDTYASKGMIGGTWWQWKQACGDPHAIGSRGHRPPCAGKSIYSDGLVTRSAANLAVITRSYPRAVPGRLTYLRSAPKTGSMEVRGVGKGDADLWVRKAGCKIPGATTRRAVGAGERVTVPVSGNYVIRVTCN